MTQREFVLGLIEAALEAAEQQNQEEVGVGPCEAPDGQGDTQPQEDK